MKTIKILFAAAMASLFCINISADTSVSTGEITGLYQEKFATPNGDGSYTLTIDSYSTGSMVTEQTTTYLDADVVLVIDMSGSMKFTTSGSTSVYSKFFKVNSGDRDTSSFYCGLVSSNYYPVDYRDGKWKYYDNKSKTPTWKDFSGDTYTCGYSAVLTAAERFLINLKKDAVASSAASGKAIHHKVKILSFNNSGTYDEYGTIGVFDDVNSSYNAVFTNLIGMNNFQNATNPSSALERARTLLGAPTSTTTKSIVLFTDGSLSDDNEAKSAINSTYQGKQSKIAYFTIGWSLKTTGNDLPCLDVISSNFPDAQVTGSGSFSRTSLGTMASPTGLAADSNRKNDFYMRNTDDPMELTQYFAAVAASIAHAAKIYNLTTTTQIRDTVTSDFKLPDGFLSTDVNCYTVACNGFDSSGNPQFESKETPKTGLNISVNTTKNSVVVDGFDFKANVCMLNSAGKPTGCKLRIKFKIEPTASFKGGYNIDTNKPGSGIYESGDVKADTIGTYPIPKVAAPVDLIVSETGLKAGESATFTITRSTDSSGASKDPNFKHEVILTGPSDQETIKQVSVKVGDDNTAATYYYFVDSQLWDWRYDPDMTADSHILYDDTLPDPFTNTFPFSFSDKTGIQSSVEGRKNATM